MRLEYILEDREFILGLYDFSVDCLNDKLSEDFSIKDIIGKRHN